MQYIKFDAKPENGKIIIPEEYRDLFEGTIVTVVVFPLGPDYNESAVLELESRLRGFPLSRE